MARLARYNRPRGRMRLVDPKLGEDLTIETLQKAGTLHLKVTGTSMLPAIWPGAQVRIRRASTDEVSIGDIVLTASGAGLRLHRLVRLNGGQLQTRGDHHDHCDPPIAASRLLGVAEAVEKKSGQSRLLAWFLRKSPMLTRIALCAREVAG